MEGGSDENGICAQHAQSSYRFLLTVHAIFSLYRKMNLRTYLQEAHLNFADVLSVLCAMLELSVEEQGPKLLFVTQQSKTLHFYFDKMMPQIYRAFLCWRFWWPWWGWKTRDNCPIVFFRIEVWGSWNYCSHNTFVWHPVNWIEVVARLHWNGCGEERNYICHEKLWEKNSNLYCLRIALLKDIFAVPFAATATLKDVICTSTSLTRWKL